MIAAKKFPYNAEDHRSEGCLENNDPSRRFEIVRRHCRHDLKDPDTGKNCRDFDTIEINVLVCYGVLRPIGREPSFCAERFCLPGGVSRFIWSPTYELHRLD